MISLEQARTLSGNDVVTTDDDKIGTLDVLYADREDGEPTFATVDTGLFGTKTSFVPLADAQLKGDKVVVPYSKDQVKDAPKIDQDAELSPQEEQELYRHYGLTGGASTGTTGDVAPAGQDTSGPNTDDAMTRSEEQLRVGTEKTEAGRARLRKFVTTETQTKTVPVSHEEVVVEREPITDGNVVAATDGPAISEEEHEVTLTAEKPVVQKEAVPVERVRLGKQTVTDEVEVSEEVRKEQIDTDGVYPDDASAKGNQPSNR